MTRAIAFLAGGIVALMAFGALQLADQRLQRDSPIVRGTINQPMTFSAGDGRYTVRIGGRARVDPAAVRGAGCQVRGPSGFATILQRDSTEAEERVKPLIGTFAPGAGRTEVLCRWKRGQQFRGPVPVAVSAERTTLRRLSYVALLAALALFAAGAWQLYRAFTSSAVST